MAVDGISFAFAHWLIYQHKGGFIYPHLDWRSRHVRWEWKTIQQTAARFRCADCGFNTYHNDEYYMVHSRIWRRAARDVADRMLCIGCLETRLGRKLTSDDFSHAPVNFGAFPQSHRLLNRLKARRE